MQGKIIPGAGKRFLPGFQHLECREKLFQAQENDLCLYFSLQESDICLE
jgi:hypothetical protein